MRVLTGLQPSGSLHIGNYFGSIKQMLELQANSDLYIFIANYHALTSVKDAAFLRQSCKSLAAAFLAFGIDPKKSTFWLQSDVKEVLELYWILSGYTPMGLLERAHSYKDKVAKGKGANHDLFSYPVLMAADILLYDTQIVPVGKDQIQHVEIARDIALKFNNAHGKIFILPEARVEASLQTIKGIDGQKMSKSYQNTIDIFSTPKQQKKQIGRIITSSLGMDEAKPFDECNVYNLARLFMSEDECAALQKRYATPGEGYGHFKAYLGELMDREFKDVREKYEYFMNNEKEVEEALEMGALKASKLAKAKLNKIYDKIGL